MSDSTSGPPSPALVPGTAPVATTAVVPSTQSMSMEDFDTLNRVVSQALGICDAVQSSSELAEQHASALWAAVDLLQIGRQLLQKYAIEPRHVR